MEATSCCDADKLADMIAMAAYLWAGGTADGLAAAEEILRGSPVLGGEENMQKIDDFTQKQWSRYPWAKMVAEGGFWQLRAGEDYDAHDDDEAQQAATENVRRAAHLWSSRHTGPNGRPLKARTSVVGKRKDAIEITFVEE